MSKDTKEPKKLVPNWPRPEMETPDDKQEAVIQELLDRLIRKPKEEHGPPPEVIAKLSQEDQRVMCYKFCIARKYKIDDAEKMAREAWKFKQDNKCWEVGYFPCAFPLKGYDEKELQEFHGHLPERKPDHVEKKWKTITKSYQATFHKWDKLGHPIYLERTGAISVKSLVVGCKQLAAPGEHYGQPVCDYHTYVNELGILLCQYNEKKLADQLNGRRVLGVTVVMDCKGLGYGHVHTPALEILKMVWAVDANYYPEGMHRMCVVNCPPMTEFIYGIVKGWLDPRVRDKVVFLKPEKTTEGLLEIIDEENLPDFLGGKSSPEGGCVYVPEDAGSTEPDPDEIMTEEINIKAGKNETREFVLEAGDEVTWEFEITQHNIQFSVNFVSEEDEADGGAGEAIVDKSKSNLGTSNYIAQKSGRLVMVWDNSFSWLNSKKLRLRLVKVPKSGEAGDEKKSEEGGSR